MAPLPDHDDFSALGISDAAEIEDLFVSRFYIGCEADDRSVAWAFNSKVNPGGAKIRAMFGSDVGHWDVLDVGDVVVEARELVDDGLITESDFKEFMFWNPVELHAGVNPDFFKGTRVEKEVAAFLDQGRTAPDVRGGSARSAALSCQPAALALARTWSGVVAPAMTEVTPAWAASQAMASSSSEWPCCSANLASASIRSKFSSVATLSAKNVSTSSREPSGKASPLVLAGQHPRRQREVGHDAHLGGSARRAPRRPRRRD